MSALRDAIFEAVSELQPVTCRQAFYQLVARQVIAKTQNEYKAVCCLLADMRRDGDLPFDWISDNTRWMRKPRTWWSLVSMLRNTTTTYRRDLWQNQEEYVEIWCESDAITGVLIDITREWDVPLMVSRGFASVSFLHSAAESIELEDKPAYLYYVGDYDPSGLAIDRKIESELRGFAPDAEIHFQRVAVTAEQIEHHSLPGNPAKESDTRSRNFKGQAVEVEALPPDILRDIVRNCIEQHIDHERLQALKRVERAERDTLQTFLNQLEGAA